MQQVEGFAGFRTENRRNIVTIIDLSGLSDAALISDFINACYATCKCCLTKLSSCIRQPYAKKTIASRLDHGNSAPASSEGARFSADATHA